jgi:hypothetical protein
MVEFAPPNMSAASNPTLIPLVAVTTAPWETSHRSSVEPTSCPSATDGTAVRRARDREHASQVELANRAGDFIDDFLRIGEKVMRIRKVVKAQNKVQKCPQAESRLRHTGRWWRVFSGHDLTHSAVFARVSS